MLTPVLFVIALFKLATSDGWASLGNVWHASLMRRSGQGEERAVSSGCDKRVHD